MNIAATSVSASALLAWFALGPVGCSHRAATPPPVNTLEQDVARMAEIGWARGPSFSPDGQTVAFLSGATGVPQVWTVTAEGSDPTQLTAFDDQVTRVRWSPQPDRLAVAVAPGGGLNTQIYLVSTDGTEPTQITAGGQVNNWLGRWSQDGRWLAYASNARGTGSVDCYLYDAQAGTSKLVVKNPGIGVIDDLSDDGQRALVWRMMNRGDSDVYLVDLATGSGQLLTPHEGPAESGGALFVDDHTVLLATNVDRERMALARIRLDDEGMPGPIEVVAAREDAELDRIQRVAGDRVALMWNAGGRSELGYYHLTDGTLSQGPALPGDIAGGLTASPDGTRIAATVSGATIPQDVWILENGADAFERASRSATEGVDLASLIRPEHVTYTAHDGLELSGWLYRPKGSQGPLPYVVSFHGGPEGQERPRFRSTYQALLSKGIGVFAPNVRGSSGFGKRFVNLDNGPLRVDAVRDIESTVDHLVQAGIAHPDRIGIMGGSYGGYMVMAGLTEFPSLFAAGANLFGIVNFETFFANTEAWMAAVSTVEYGDPVEDAQMLRDLSPIHKLDKVTAPTIVLHGANDTNVPVVEAEQVVANLEERGIPVSYVLFEDEGHGWQKTENRVRSDVEIVRWFETHLHSAE